MRNWFPLADYDFWGYLAAGFVLTFGLGGALGVPLTGELLQDPIAIAIVLAAAYTLGHANAAISSWLLERCLVNGLVGAPVAVLIGERRPPAALRGLAPSYNRLPSFTLAAIKARLKVDALPSGEEVFQRAFHFARQFDDVRDRMDQFRNQYGFCRNAALAVVIAGAIGLEWAQGREVVWLAAVFATALLLMARYLKFYRLFAAEALNTFAFRGVS
jgi:hypothetical protein